MWGMVNCQRLILKKGIFTTILCGRYIVYINSRLCRNVIVNVFFNKFMIRIGLRYHDVPGFLE